MHRDANLSYSVTKLLAWVIAPFLIYAIPAESMYEGQSLCLFTNIFGVHCYGCGITRAIYAAMHFDFGVAVEYNVGVVVILPLLVYLWLRGGYRLFGSCLKSRHEKN